MNTIIERITEAIKDILIGLIKSSLDNMFTSVNEQVGTIAGQVGQTPQGWNAGIFNLIQNISQTVIVPIAGLIITFVLCYELITMVTQKNNFHEFETYNIFLWIFKAYVAIYLVTNTFNITMAVFDVGQHVVNNAAGVISGNTAVDATEAISRIVDAHNFTNCGCPGGYGVRGFVPAIHGNDVDQCYHAHSVNYHYGNLVRKNDRNLPLYFHSTNSVCHHDQ